MSSQEHSRRHYEKHRDAIKAAVKEQKRQLATEIKALKESKPCADCGRFFRYWVTHFDHRPGAEKVGVVSRFAANGSRIAALAEIEKCDLVCANCHADRTHARLQVRL